MVEQSGEPFLLPLSVLLAAHRSIPGTLRSPLCVGRVWDRTMFSLVCALPSPASAEGGPSLFGWFTGTTVQSDSSRPCMSAVRLMRLRGPVSICWMPRRPGGLPVLVHVVSQRARVLRLRRTERATRVFNVAVVLPSSSRNGVGVLYQRLFEAQ